MNISQTKNLLKTYRIRPNKLRGQNFLVNPRAAEGIVKAARIGSNETVLEVGPGLGGLTGPLLEQARRVIAVEIDARLCAVLGDLLGDRPGLTLIREDFLKVDLAVMAQEAGPGGLRVVGNLPYQITGQAVRKILDHLHLLRGAVITVQREVANRMVSSPGGKTFGILSVAAQYLSRPELVLRLPREAFYPRPQVASAVVVLEPRERYPIDVRDQALFFTVVRALFGHRRKTARNALKSHPSLGLSRETLEEVSRRTGIDLGRRGETMALGELGAISDALWEIQHAHSTS